jgi:hypothetical protein
MPLFAGLVPPCVLLALGAMVLGVPATFLGNTAAGRQVMRTTFLDFSFMKTLELL